MSLSPAFTAAVVLSLLVGALAQFIFGGDGRRLLGFFVTAGLGFALGQGFGEIIGTQALRLGPLHLLPALIGALSAVLVTALITRQRSD